MVLAMTMMVHGLVVSHYYRDNIDTIVNPEQIVYYRIYIFYINGVVIWARNLLRKIKIYTS